MGASRLVNNASAIALLVPDEDEAWQASLTVDMMGTARASRKVIPWIAEQGGGSIVHISSLAGRMHISIAGFNDGPSAGSAVAYGAMKAAMISHSKSLASAVARQRIRVNTVVPVQSSGLTAVGIRSRKTCRRLMPRLPLQYRQDALGRLKRLQMPCFFSLRNGRVG